MIDTSNNLFFKIIQKVNWGARMFIMFGVVLGLQKQELLISCEDTVTGS